MSLKENPKSSTLNLLFFLLCYSQAQSCVIQKSMSLKYEPASEPLHIGQAPLVSLFLYQVLQVMSLRVLKAVCSPSLGGAEASLSGERIHRPAVMTRAGYDSNKL